MDTERLRYDTDKDGYATTCKRHGYGDMDTERLLYDKDKDGYGTICTRDM